MHVMASPKASSRLMRPALVALMLSFGLGAQSDPNPQKDLAERLYISGENAFLAKRFDEAMETWKQLLAQAPQSPLAAQALLSMARYHLELQGPDHAKHKETALNHLEQIRQKHIKQSIAAQALLLRGQVLASQAQKPGELKEAMAELHRILDLFPNHVAVLDARLELGRCSLLQNQPAQAMRHLSDLVQRDPKAPQAAQALLLASESLNRLGDLNGSIRMLQRLRRDFPQNPFSEEAAWRMRLLIKQRILRPPFVSEGAWPKGRQDWLKSPTHLSFGLEGQLFIYQDGLDRAFGLKKDDLIPMGEPLRNARGLCFDGTGICMVNSRQLRRGNGITLDLPNLGNASGICADIWQNLWISDAKGGLSLVDAKGQVRSLPSPGGVAIANLSDGVVLASDTNRSLLFLDFNGQVRLTLPYGKDFPKPFKNVVALATDPAGHVAAIVDGDFEGVAVWSREGELLRHAEFKSLGLKGKFRGLALDFEGGLILADRSNDLLIRLN